MAKVRRNIVMPANVPDTARAEFAVTLLPGGSVLQARLLKPSGSTAYDNAVERAILKSDPLPLPPDVALFNKFRELKLIFQPTGQ
jgi:colicin import membrane protein